MARTAARLEEEGGGGAVVAAGAGEEAEGGVGRRRSRTALVCFATNSMLGTVEVCGFRGGGVSLGVCVWGCGTHRRQESAKERGR